MKRKKSYIILLSATITAFVLLNLVASKARLRLDVTGDSRYTLSQATQNTLKNINQEVKITVYFSKNLPPQFETIRQEFKDLLTEYQNLSHQKISYAFINPSEDEKHKEQAHKNGIRPIIIDVREKDKIEQQQIYIGAVISSNNQTETIPMIQTVGAEYDLTTKIRKLTATDKPLIGLLQGHGEPSIMEITQLYQELNLLYRFEPISIEALSDTSKHYKTIAVIRPKDSIPEADLHQLDQFVENGGNLFLGINRVDGDMRKSIGHTVYTNIGAWLEKKGLIIENRFLVDAQCGGVTVQQQQDFFMISNNVKFPFLPIISNFNDHPITHGLEAIILPFASPLKFINQNPDVSFEPLAYSSQQSDTIAPPHEFDFNRKWSENDFRQQNLPVAGIMKQDKGQSGKVVVIADGDFMVNGVGQQQQQLQPDNIFFVVNAIDWLSDDTGLIKLRTKGGNFRPIAQTNEETKLFFKYINFLLPILLVIGYGLIRSRARQKERKRRMEQNYS